MKKLASVILIIIYFAFSAGATVSLHYCMGEYTGFSFNLLKEDPCSKCEINKHKDESNCCNDIVVKAKVSDVHSGSYTPHTKAIPAFYCTPNFPDVEQVTVPIIPMFTFSQKHPPGYRQSSLYILHKNFRI